MGGTTMVRLIQAMMTALGNQKILLASLVTKMKMQLKHLYSDVYFAEVEIVETAPENPALVMIAIVNVKVAREAVNHEKVKMLPQKHQKMFLNFDVLLEEMDANAARDLTQQSLTESLILLASLEKLFLEKSIKLLKQFL